MYSGSSMYWRRLASLRHTMGLFTRVTSLRLFSLIRRLSASACAGFCRSVSVKLSSLRCRTSWWYALLPLSSKGTVDMTQAALSQLRAWMAEQGIDALFVTQPHNRSYLSGWLEDEAESGSLLVGQQQQIVLTNHLYAEVVERDAKGWRVIVPPAREQINTIVSLAQEH